MIKSSLVWIMVILVFSPTVLYSSPVPSGWLETVTWFTPEGGTRTSVILSAYQQYGTLWYATDLKAAPSSLYAQNIALGATIREPFFQGKNLDLDIMTGFITYNYLPYICYNGTRTDLKPGARIKFKLLNNFNTEVSVIWPTPGAYLWAWNTMVDKNTAKFSLSGALQTPVNRFANGEDNLILGFDIKKNISSRLNFSGFYVSSLLTERFSRNVKKSGNAFDFKVSSKEYQPLNIELQLWGQSIDFQTPIADGKDDNRTTPIYCGNIYDYRMGQKGITLALTGMFGNYNLRTLSLERYLNLANDGVGQRVYADIQSVLSGISYDLKLGYDNEVFKTRYGSKECIQYSFLDGGISRSYRNRKSTIQGKLHFMYGNSNSEWKGNSWSGPELEFIYRLNSGSLRGLTLGSAYSLRSLAQTRDVVNVSRFNLAYTSPTGFTIQMQTCFLLDYPNRLISWFNDSSDYRENLLTGLLGNPLFDRISYWEMDNYVYIGKRIIF